MYTTNDEYIYTVLMVPTQVVNNLHLQVIKYYN